MMIDAYGVQDGSGRFFAAVRSKDGQTYSSAAIYATEAEALARARELARRMGGGGLPRRTIRRAWRYVWG